MDVNEDFSTFIQEILKGLAAEKGECIECEFLMCCQGYFKWPRSEYRCDGVKALMNTLRSAAEELRADIASLHSSEEGGPP
jgi:sulfatase maturation enzyme AslB (radical SAM superfamily)